LRDRCAQSKGGGAPSVLDAGPLLKELKRAAAIIDLNGAAPGSDSLTREIETISQKQERVARAIWGEVAALTQRISAVVAPTEDLVAAMAVVDKLVDAAHTRGQLPAHDDRSTYMGLRNSVESVDIARWKRLAATLLDSEKPRTLWEVMDDPTPALQRVSAYVADADRLVRHIEASFSTVSANAAGGRQPLEAALRSLADALDSLDKVG
jgi:hypothetical protein